MSPVERAVRVHKRRTDLAISRAYSQLAPNPPARGLFDDLLRHVRARAPRLLESPAAQDAHPGVDVLVNLARHGAAHIRRIADWPGCSESWLPAVDSLAQHLLSRYRIPAFLSAAWYATDDLAAAKRRWFIGHSSGESFRSLGLPIRLTRAMEHIFIRSPRHFGIEYALRRAELIGLGADEGLVAAVLAAQPATDLHHGDFWRTTWRFLIANARAIEKTQVGPIIDFLHAIRHERVAVDIDGEVVFREPPEPDFSLKGRTAASVLRLMEEWHHELGSTTGGLAWEPSRLSSFHREVPSEDPEAPPISWELVELTNSESLRAEGAALRHCVASYWYACWRGKSQIWSLRRRRGLHARPVATIEVNPQRRTIVQARGFRNRRLTARERSLVQHWAYRERLGLAV